MVIRPPNSSNEQSRIRQANTLTLDRGGGGGGDVEDDEEKEKVGRETATVSNYNKQRTSAGKLPDIYPSGMP